MRFCIVALCIPIILTACRQEADRNHPSSPAFSNGGTSHRQLLESELASSCTANDDGTQDCIWDDGDSFCTYGVSADDQLSYQNCSGTWGEYNCENTGTEIDCIFVNAAGDQCTDTWSFDYELVDSTCDFGFYEPSEECVTGEDGLTTCTWTDGYADCVVVFDEYGALLEQQCIDGTMTYSCTGTLELVECVMSIDGEELCIDTWTQTGEPIELGCAEQFPQEEPGEQCETNDDGTTTCTLTDGAMTCVTTTDANDVMTMVHCEDGVVVHDCVLNPEDGLLYCEYRQGDELLCEEVFDANEQVVSSTCGYPGESDYPEEEDTMECSSDDQGHQTCTSDNGCTSCTIEISSTSYFQSCTDGVYQSTCETTPDGSATACDYSLDGVTLCIDTYTPDGAPLEITCDEYHALWGSACVY